MKTRKILAMLLSLVMVIGLMTPAAMAEEEGTGLSGTGIETDPYLIEDLDDLVLFRNSVNAGEITYNAPGVYVALNANIDLTGVDWSVNIGDDCNATFDGIFDGKNHTIYNLNSTETAQKDDGYVCTGLFGAIYGSAVVKNLTIENVSINTGDFTGNNVGAVVGFVYAGSGSIENVTVCGDIKINAPGVYGVGAIVGYAYQSPSLTIKDCVVEGDADSAIVSSSGAGAIIGYCGGNVTIEDCEVSGLSITGKGLVGGIAGTAHGTCDFESCTVKNVSLTTTKDEWINGSAIVVGALAGNGLTVSGTIYDETVKANGEAIDRIVGSTYIEKPTDVVPAVQARIGNTYYLTLTDAIAAAKADNTITLLSDVTLTEGVTIPAGKTVTLDLNGYTISQTKVQTEAYAMVVNLGNLTIKDDVGTGKMTYQDTATYTEDPGWASDTILNHGTLTITGGTIENTSEGTVVEYGYPHAVDTGTYSKVYPITGDVSLTITGGTIKNAHYSAIRMFCNSSVYNTKCEISGTSNIVNAVDFQLPNKGKLLGELTISGGTFSTTEDGSRYAVRAFGFGDDGSGMKLSITGGTFNAPVHIYKSPDPIPVPDNFNTKFITGGTFSEDPSAYVAEGYKVVGTYQVIPADSYLVTFDANGGDAVASAYSHTLTSLPTANRSGSYSFNGWYLADGTKVTSVSEITADTTLIAHWIYTGGSSSSGGGSSSGSSNTTTTTEKNPDGSTTTTTTNKTTGTVTETTKNTDGTTGVVKTDEDGNVTEITATVPTAAANTAAKNDEPVTLPITSVEAVTDSDDAVEIDVNVPSGGATVEIPVEDVTPGTVVVIVNKDGTETIVPTSTLTEDGVVVTLDEDATIKVIDNSKNFTDVPDDYALADSIDFVSARGLFEGNTETTFNPHADTTIAQTMTVLARLSGEDFYGAGSTAKGAEWAEERGLSDGSDVSKPITREQMVVMMWKLAGSPESNKALTASDVGDISANAMTAMQWAVEMGILKGNLDGSLDPQGNASRAHVAAFSERYVNAIA